MDGCIYTVDTIAIICLLIPTVLYNTGYSMSIVYISLNRILYWYLYWINELNGDGILYYYVLVYVILLWPIYL